MIHVSLQPKSGDLSGMGGNPVITLVGVGVQLLYFSLLFFFPFLRLTAMSGKLLSFHSFSSQPCF
jgi:hypothetical protein